MANLTDVITPEIAGSLPGLFAERVKRSSEAIAYRAYSKPKALWVDYTWADMSERVDKVRAGLLAEGLQQGDCIALLMSNRPEWVVFEQAALGAGLVVIPLYPNDRSENISYILKDANVKLLIIEADEHCKTLKSIRTQLENLKRIILLEQSNESFSNMSQYEQWHASVTGSTTAEKLNGDTVATIVYTSGTTGRPKGVMLSHNNILYNAYACSQCTGFYPTDNFLSFLPLSHMFERTAGYYLPLMTGATVTYARSIDQLSEDLLEIKPTIFVTVPRIFERVHKKITTQLKEKSPVAQYLFHKTIDIGWHFFRYQQNKASWHPKLLFHPLLQIIVAKKITRKLGGKLRLAISGGAPLSIEVGKTFIALGLTITQGYGMTELSPVVSTNLLHDNEPDSVGQALFNVQVKLGEHDELCVKGPSVMLGYLHNKQATKKCIDEEGWLHTGDIAKIIDSHIYITGRIKEILVLSNGEKIPPADIEMAISNETLIEQVLVVGEGKPFLSAICVLNEDVWKDLSTQHNFDSQNCAAAHDFVKALIKKQLLSFPGYANIYGVHTTLEPWTIDNGLITPTLKLKRKYILDKYHAEVEALYEGH